MSAIRTARASAMTVIAVALGVAEAAAQSRKADSTSAVALLRESATAARLVPATERRRQTLLHGVASAQVLAGDFAGALGTSSDVGLSRRAVQTDVACRLLEDRRFDEARRVVSRFPQTDRDWALAHLASQLARPPHSLRRERGDPVDTARLVRRALAVAREVRAAAPRVDALLSIANAQTSRNDSAGAVATLLAAQSALRSVRDPDFISSRRMLVATGLGRAGRIDEALRMLRSLPTRDRLAATWNMRGWRNVGDPRVRGELRAVEALLPRVRDAQARATAAEGIAEAYRAAGESARADSITARYRVIDAATARPWHWDDVRPSLGERAESLATAGALGRAIALADSIPDVLRVGLRARTYLRLANTLQGTRRDTLRTLLDRARANVLSSTLSDTLRDMLLVDIGAAQMQQGFHDDGIATADRIVVNDLGVSVLLNTNAGLSPRERRAIIRRAANEELRAAASAGLVRQVLANDRAAPDDIAWATALADSLPPGAASELAQIGVALKELARRDSAGARTRLLRLTASHVPDFEPILIEHDRSQELWALLVGAGASDDAIRSARAFRDPAARASALLVLGNAIRVRGQVSKLMWITNGSDSCRDEF